MTTSNEHIRISAHNGLMFVSIDFADAHSMNDHLAIIDKMANIDCKGYAELTMQVVGLHGCLKDTMACLLYTSPSPRD